VYYYDDQRRLVWHNEKTWPNPTPLEQYIADLYYAGFVISVDTSAIHFREGLAKPALGLYSSFSTESRTKYYTYTHSIDIKSPCTLAPCFMNFKRCPVGEQALKEYGSQDYAPCLGEENELLVTQIREELKKTIL
jgi:ADP-heptose:LPS heptosyltransferase